MVSSPYRVSAVSEAKSHIGIMSFVDHLSICHALLLLISHVFLEYLKLLIKVSFLIIREIRELSE